MSAQSDAVSGCIDTGPAITNSFLHKQKTTLISILKHCIVSQLIPDCGCEITNLCICFNIQILLFSVKPYTHILTSEQKCLYVIL